MEFGYDRTTQFTTDTPFKRRIKDIAGKILLSISILLIFTLPLFTFDGDWPSMSIIGLMVFVIAVLAGSAAYKLLERKR
jgi:hypothetical protein